MNDQSGRTLNNVTTQIVKDFIRADSKQKTVSTFFVLSLNVRGFLFFLLHKRAALTSRE